MRNNLILFVYILYYFAYTDIIQNYTHTHTISNTWNKLHFKWCWEGYINNNKNNRKIQQQQKNILFTTTENSHTNTPDYLLPFHELTTHTLADICIKFPDTYVKAYVHVYTKKGDEPWI